MSGGDSGVGERTRSIPFERSELAGSIVSRFGKIVALQPSASALSGAGEAWTYADLGRRASQVGRAVLDRVGLGRACVAYLVDHSPAMVICAFGCLNAVRPYLCLHPNMPVTALRDIIRDAAPALVITDLAHEAIARDACDGGVPLLLLDEIGTDAPLAPLDLEIDPADPAVVFYTSGSTGRPKGVAKSHRTVLHRAWLCARYDGVSPQDRQSLLTHCSFASSEADCFGALLNGAAISLFDVSSRGFSGFGDWIDQQGISLLHPPVVLFRRYLSRLDGSGRHPSVRLVALAGEAVLASDIVGWRERFAPSCALRHRFSSTEAGHIAVAGIDPFQPVIPEEMPLPQPVEDKFLAILDADGTPRDSGSGELMVRSAFLADGYWRRPEETAERFGVDPRHPGERVFRTGDFVHLGTTGVEFIGRQDSQVKISGYRVEIPEIEQALARLPGVAEAVVVADRKAGGNVLVAFVVMQVSGTFRQETLKSALRPVLPPWKIPTAIHFTDALPLTLTGKVDRQLLRERLVRPS